MVDAPAPLDDAGYGALIGHDEEAALWTSMGRIGGTSFCMQAANRYTAA